MHTRAKKHTKKKLAKAKRGKLTWGRMLPPLHSHPTFYSITSPSGIRFIGAVQGSGGILKGEEGLKRLRLASKGRYASANIYTKEVDGYVCVLLYPDYSANTNGRKVYVHIENATVKRAVKL